MEKHKRLEGLEVPDFFDIPKEFKPTSMTFFERFCLLFAKRRIKTTIFHYAVYKIFFGKEYILKSGLKLPEGQNCRCFVKKIE